MQFKNKIFEKVLTSSIGFSLAYRERLSDIFSKVVSQSSRFTEKPEGYYRGAVLTLPVRDRKEKRTAFS
jgi:hypothetical protein